LFDALAPLHQLPPEHRALLEAAALLHDVGHTVSYQRHHKHSYYLIKNADLPGLADRERDLVALVARFHRRSPPERKHADMAALSSEDFRTVRMLATLLRLSDSLDRSHHQSVKAVEARTSKSAVVLTLRARAPVDLEVWDAQHEAALFRRVFGRKLELKVAERTTRQRAR
jgi:exopolyphosphatase/guanosine-5'-triphosphate,3'-diphosphate pyrophosphatase